MVRQGPPEQNRRAHHERLNLIATPVRVQYSADVGANKFAPTHGCPP